MTLCNILLEDQKVGPFVLGVSTILNHFWPGFGQVFSPEIVCTLELGRLGAGNGFGILVRLLVLHNFAEIVAVNVPPTCTCGEWFIFQRIQNKFHTLY